MTAEAKEKFSSRSSLASFSAKMQPKVIQYRQLDYYCPSIVLDTLACLTPQSEPVVITLPTSSNVGLATMTEVYAAVRYFTYIGRRYLMLSYLR